MLLRLRRAVGDIVVRSGSGLRLAPGLRATCTIRAAGHRRPVRGPADPELAGQLAAEAVASATARLFADFEYDEWAVTARRAADQQMISLLDLLSVQAEDAGDLPVAQALAERALRLDRYTDSRYVRLAELLTLQNRVAAAIAVLDDAAAVAREMGDPGRDEAPPRRLLRRTAARRVCSGRRPTENLASDRRRGPPSWAHKGGDRRHDGAILRIRAVKRLDRRVLMPHHGGVRPTRVPRRVADAVSRCCDWLPSRCIHDDADLRPSHGRQQL